MSIPITSRAAAATALSLCLSPACASALNVAITAQPPALGADAAAAFEFEATAAAGFECALDGGAYAACTSPHIVLPVANGAHQLAIRAYDANGARGATSIAAWTVVSPFAAQHADLIPTAMTPDPVAPNSWRGILRINCDFSHAAYDDPLVFHAQPDAAHYHNFYGAFDVDAFTTRDSLYTAAATAGGRVTSCQGNRLNRSAYWVPALLAPLYDANGVRQLDADGAPAWQVVDAVVGNDDVAHEVFYYSAGIDDLAAIQLPPPGLGMVAGTASTQPSAPQSSSVIRWHCQSWNASDAGNPDFRAYIPECVAPDRLRFDIFFPSCWNGVDLDAPDHKRHMAYPETVGGVTRCPASHPVAIPRVSYHYAFPVKPDNVEPVTRSTRGWRLASDMYVVDAAQPGGHSLHGGWINGWHPEVLQAVIDGCIKAARDCHDGNLNNGYRLSGTAAGAQQAQPIVQQGLGASHDLDAIFKGGGFEADSAAKGHVHH